MKKTILILVSALLIGISFTACGPNDAKISEATTTALAAYADVKAEVKDGVLTLTGIAENDEAKSQIESLVKAVKGVKSVVNNLEVKPLVVINPDDAITTAVTTALTAGGFKDVVATIKDGEVTLTGELKKSDLIQVMQLVNATNPKKVINELKLK